MKCAIIGSGIAGIASAIRLRLLGHEVDVFEANAVPGGKIREHREHGFRFDMGPSVFTMPELVNELFELAGKKRSEYFQYEKLDPSFRFFFDDGTQLDWASGMQGLTQEIISKTKEGREDIQKYFDDAALKHSITKEVFMENSLHIAANYFSKPFLLGMTKLHKVGAFTSMNKKNSSLFSDNRIIQLFNHFALYVGSNPLVAPSTLNIITHIISQSGTYLPSQGMFSVVRALVKLAEELGVKFRFQSRVDEIEISDQQVVGIKVNGEQLAFDRVVSNMDIYFTYHKLLPNQKKPSVILSQPKSSSIIGFLWGMNGTHPNLEVHNMLFAKERDDEYKDLFDRGTIGSDPSTYICISSKRNKEDAPAGKENWFVHTTAPNMNGQDWDRLVEQTRQNIIRKIERMLGKPIQNQIECEKIISPPTIENDYSSAFGAIYGNSSNGKLAAFLRHPNFSRSIKGLYFVGGTVHPGAGVPMCLNSAKILEKVFE
jgi:phytoene desaturase